MRLRRIDLIITKKLIQRYYFKINQIQVVIPVKEKKKKVGNLISEPNHWKNCSFFFPEEKVGYSWRETICIANEEIVSETESLDSNKVRQRVYSKIDWKCIVERLAVSFKDYGRIISYARFLKLFRYRLVSCLNRGHDLRNSEAAI